MDEPGPLLAPKPQEIHLDAEERRVLGTLIEKGLSTPQQYPLTLQALTTGANQRNNRDPITNYAEDQVEATCTRLQAKGLVSRVLPSSGRVHRWRQELGRLFEFRRAEMSIIGELLLRGPQSEGDLRQRASRMQEIPTLEELEQLLEKLRHTTPVFVVRLSPEGMQRGVRYTHGLYLKAELAAIVDAEQRGAPAPAFGGTPAVSRGSQLEELRERVDELEKRVARLEAALESRAG